MTNSIAPAPSFSPDDIGQHCLVTGGAGYLGSALVKRLQQAGCQVRSLDLRTHQHPKGVEIFTGDLCDPATLAQACDGIDTVFHTAALIDLSSLYRKKQRELVFAVNVEGTRLLIKAAQAAGATAFIQTSSGNVIMDRVLDDKDETTPYATRTSDLYSLSKIEAEKLVLTANNTGAMRCCALRPGGLWGDQVDSVMIRSFLDQLKSGNFKALIGDGRSAMDNTHIENLLDAQLLAAQGLRQQADKVGGEAFFIFDGERINPMQWFQPLTEALGHSFPHRRIGGPLALAIAWSMEAAHYLGAPQGPLSVRAVRNLIESSNFRIDKAKRVLGYQPRYSRDNGLATLLPAARAYMLQ